MPTSEGGGFAHVSGDEDASARILRGVGPDKPTAPPEPPTARPRGFDWGAGSKVQPTMTQQERKEVLRKARATGAVPDRFSSPPTSHDGEQVSYAVTEADRAAAAQDAPAPVPSQVGPPDDFDPDGWPDAPGPGECLVVGGQAETIVELPPMDSRPVGSPEPARVVEPAPEPVAPAVRVRAPREKPAWRRDRDARIVALYRAGTTTTEIAKTIECGQGTIYFALRDAGVIVGEGRKNAPRSERGSDAAKPVRTGYDYPRELVEEVARLYVVEGLSQEAVGRKLGRSQIWVSTMMRRCGIERRRSGARPKPIDLSPPPLPPISSPLPQVEPSVAVVEELAAFPWQAVYDQLVALTELVVASAEQIGVAVR